MLWTRAAQPPAVLSQFSTLLVSTSTAAGSSGVVTASNVVLTSPSGVTRDGVQQCGLRCGAWFCENHAHARTIRGEAVEVGSRHTQSNYRGNRPRRERSPRQEIAVGEKRARTE
eukprot:3657760-Amphidinium_carterae.1